ncbi:HCCA isomerase/glutathione S-transferase kappa [Diaporthe sp. PMI_573]|nr:HCCA isomerase/glutathione S-transferase kappa [Diaporthaceae sp. PMI_573]
MKITFYVDVVSPFAYIAYYVLRHDPVFKGCQITYIPIFLGGLFKKTGNTSPIQIRNKDRWIDNERLRWARYFNVPIVTDVPEGFPANTLHIMRIVCALGRLACSDQPPTSSPSQPSQEAVIRALDAFFDIYWARGHNITEKDVTAEVLMRVGGKDFGNVSRLAAGEAKMILAENTDRAFADGAFGLPWFACENDRGEREGVLGRGSPKRGAGLL